MRAGCTVTTGSAGLGPAGGSAGLGPAGTPEAPRWWTLFAVASLLTLLALPATAGPLAEARLLCLEGQDALTAADAEAARRAFESAATLDPDLPCAHHGRGLALARLERLDEAIEALEVAARCAPGDPSVHADLALAYLAAGDDFWAADELALAAELVPDDSAVAFWEGVVLLRLRDLRGARAAFNRAGEEQDHRLSLYRGLLELQEGQVEPAQRHFAVAAEASSPWSAPAAEASAELTRRAWDVPPAWRGAVQFGGLVDTNVTLDPETAPLPDDSASAGLLLGGQLTASPWATQRNLLSGTLSVDRVSYLADRPSQLSVTGFGGEVLYRHRLAATWLTHDVLVAARYDLTLLDGGELTDAPDLHAYRESPTLRLRYGLDDGERHRAYADVRAGYAWFSDMRRDGWSLRAELGDTVSLAGGRIKVFAAVLARLDRAEGRGFDLWGAGARLGVSAVLPGELGLTAQARFEHRDHVDSAFYSGWGADGRVDDVLTTQLALDRALWGPLSARAAWTHAEHGSTVASYEYRRDEVSLSLLARWP